MKNQNTLNAKNQAKHDARMAEHNRKEQLATDNGYKGECRLKAGSNSVYSYKGSAYGFDSKSEARDHFLSEKGLDKPAWCLRGSTPRRVQYPITTKTNVFMSALIKLLETTHDLVKSKIKTIEAYEAQIDSIIKTGARIGKSVNEISSVVQNLRLLIQDEFKQIQALHNDATKVLREYMTTYQTPVHPSAYQITPSSRNTTPIQDYEAEGMAYIRGAHNDQYAVLNEELRKAS